MWKQTQPSFHNLLKVTVYQLKNGKAHLHFCQHPIGFEILYERSLSVFQLVLVHISVLIHLVCSRAGIPEPYAVPPKDEPLPIK